MTTRTLLRSLLPLAASLAFAGALAQTAPAPAPARPPSPQALARARADSAARASGIDSLGRTTPGRALSDSDRRPADMPPRPVLRPAPAATASANPNGPAVPATIPGFWRTRAERSGWRQTSDYDETMRYCRQLEAGSRWLKLVSYGTSGQGRELPMLIVSKDRAFTPEAARATGKPVVLIQNGIHSGEIEGKDASLALVRDLAVLHQRTELLDSCIVLVLPIYSVDAHERRSRYNRINQNGPDEMGWRSTPLGLNLNRDYMKAEAPETRALLANVYTKWWPELLVDDHTTDGADYRHDVTYSFQHGAGVPAPLDRWMSEAFEGRVVKRLTELGHLPAPYLSFRRGSDVSSGIDFTNSDPRFSTGYAPLHARAALLVETHMLKPYGDRVKATYDLLLALLEELHAHPRALTGAVRAAEAEAIARGREPVAARRTLVLETRTTDRAVPFAFRGKATVWQASDITGTLVPRYSSAPWDTILSLYREMAPTLTAQQPAGYLVPQEWSAAIDRLQIHGLVFRRLAKAYRDTVEMQRIVEWNAEAQGFEGHHLVHVTKVALERQSRAFRPGDVWVPLDQRSGALAVNLFEAQAPDGLMAWNFFDTVFQKKEYGEDYVVEPLARQMLAKDPQLAKEFATKVAADTAFAHSPGARVDFFYRRSPWTDPDQDLHPVARALHAVPEIYLVPVAGAASEPGTGARH